LLDTNLDDLLMACIEGKLANFPPLKWKKQSSVCVVMAAGGYPDKVELGQFVTGIGKAEDHGACVFQSGTKLKNNALVTNGGRVLGVTALGDDIQKAIANVYSAIEFITYDGMYYRKDIASKAIA
jgi:phosphoribosylamine--glycine ligase